MAKNLSAFITIDEENKLIKLHKNSDVQVYSTPKMGGCADNEIKIRIIKRSNDVLLHITAPDAKSLEKAVKKFCPNDTNLLTEFCG